MLFLVAISQFNLLEDGVSLAGAAAPLSRKGARPCVRVCTQITFSSAKGKPEDYFKRAKGQIVKAREKWLELMGLVGVKP